MRNFWNIGIEYTTIMFCVGLLSLSIMLIFSDELREMFNERNK